MLVSFYWELLGQRYATISFGTILLSIYSMFGLGEYAHWYQQPTYFVYGALWYGLTSILFLFLNQHFLYKINFHKFLKKFQPYFKLKHGCSTPDNKENVEQLLFELSLQNTQVAQSLNQIRSSLLTRLKASRVSNKSIYWLNLYFLREIYTSRQLLIIYTTSISNKILAVVISFFVFRKTYAYKLKLAMI